MATITGYVEGPTPDYSHTTLQNKTLTAKLGANKRIAISAGSVENTGNVPQTVDITASNPVGCTIEQVSAVIGPNAAPLPAVLQPGGILTVSVRVFTDDVAVGDPDVPFSIDVNDTWS